MLKVALVAPAGTVTLAGTVAVADRLCDADSEIGAPPLGAGDVSTTVPVELFPPLALEGFKDSEDRLVLVDVAVKLAAIVWFAVTLVKV